MSEATFEKFERQVLPSVRSLQFGGTNLGEPLASRSFQDYLQRIATSESLREIKVQTNGTLATDALLHLLVKLNVLLMVSLEGVTDKSYRKTRQCDFDRLAKILKTYRDLRQAQPASTAQLFVSFTACYDTLAELESVVEFGADVGAARIIVTHYVPIRESHRFQSLYYHRGEANLWFEKAACRAKQLGLAFIAPEPFPIIHFGEQAEGEQGDHRQQRPCFHPWGSVSINEQGDVMPCCGTNAVMGNLHKQDFIDIWYGRRFRQLRSKVNSPRPPSYCRGCLMRGIDLDNPQVQLTNIDGFLLSQIGFSSHEDNLKWLLHRVQRRIIRKLIQRMVGRSLGRAVIPTLRSLYNRMK